jgi:hypothetical protein
LNTNQAAIANHTPLPWATRTTTKDNMNDNNEKKKEINRLKARIHRGSSTKADENKYFQLTGIEPKSVTQETPVVCGTLIWKVVQERAQKQKRNEKPD